jgi:adenylate cyclase
MLPRMEGTLNRAFASLFGDHRRSSLEHRLFNTISLLNAVANIGGAVGSINLVNSGFLAPLHLGTGALFLAFYYCSRFRNTYRPLFWPFVLLMVVFLFANALGNAGSLGGAHYYLIPALVIATILSASARTTVLALLLFAAATGLLFIIEERRPDLISQYSDPRQRLFDVSSNLVFVQVFTSVLVMVLTRNLNQERRKSDRLLLNVLPEPIAEELKRHDRVEPRAYESASVLFTDMVGFTKISERLTPEELIDELDACFREFDAIARRRGLEKIKTIGDAFMAAGGIPAPNRTHAVDCVLAAIEIQRFMRSMRDRKMAENRPYWQLRLGIHSGPIVAGVIGREKFAYDVWGDTVNTASRLESSGMADRINVSSATYELIKDFFVCEHRGRVAAKSKGEIDMYFVERIRPELSADEEGLAPNGRFQEMYREIAGS